MKKVCFIGPISPPISGPSVKNKMMTDWLKNNCICDLYVLNTNDFRKLSVVKLLKSIVSFLFVKNVVLSVSENGRFIFIPICFLLRKRIILFPAGGSFDLEIRSLNKIKRFLFLRICTKIHSTYVETTQLKESLTNMGFKNVRYFPNPRIERGFKIENINEVYPLKIVFLSKIREGKGPLLLIESVNKINSKSSYPKLELDFYGIIEESFKDKFFKYVDNSESVKYKGVSPHEDVQQNIAKYDIFVLPTTFPEGIPGAVVEAMFTGIPIIISNFTAANELITNNVDGIVIPQNDQNALTEAIEILVLNRDLRAKFSKRVIEKSERFNFNVLMESFVDDMINI